jgi:hypothetical protein
MKEDLQNEATGDQRLQATYVPRAAHAVQAAEGQVREAWKVGDGVCRPLEEMTAEWQGPPPIPGT